MTNKLVLHNTKVVFHEQGYDDVTLNEDDEKHLIRQELIEKILKKVILYCFSVFSVDAYGIYTSNKRLKSYHMIYSLPEVKEMTEKRQEKNTLLLKTTWYRLFIAYQLYLCIKFLLLAFIELIAYQSYTDYEVHHQSCLDRKETLLLYQKNVTKHLYHNNNHNYSKFELYIIELGNKIGNPLQTFPGSASIIYIGFTIVNVICNTSIPIYFKIYPMDAVHLRLLLNKDIEIWRIDYLIKEKLLHIIKNQTIKFQTYVKEYTNIFDNNNNVNSNNYNQEKKLYSYRLFGLEDLEKIIESLKLVIHEMRPSIYDPSFHDTHVNVSAFIFVCVYLSFSPYVAVMVTTFEQEVMNCQLNNNFTKLEWFTYFEMVFSFGFASCVLSYTAIVILVNVVTQFVSVSSIIKELKACLDITRKRNFSYLLKRDICLNNHNNNEMYQKLEKQKIIFNKPKESIVLSLDHHKNKELINSCLDNELEVDRKLLKTFIKITISELDVKSNNCFISTLLNFYLSTMITSYFIMLAAGRLNRHDLYNIRLYLIYYLYLSTNLVLCCCAIAYAQWIHVSKFGYSLLAELAIKSERCDQLIWNNFIAVSWHRLICSGCLSDDRMSVNACKLFSINFKNVLSLNIVYFSLAALLNTYY